MLRQFINICILAALANITSVQGFIIPTLASSVVRAKTSSSYATQLHSDSTVGTETPSTSSSTTPSPQTPIDPKEAVKIFGRLAEKYILLDDSGGMCCYSACSDCEFRLPDGGYKMADQSAARPKWIPCYDERKFASASAGKEHVSNWSTGIFCTGPSVTKGEFVERVKGMSFAPPLGGPYVSASSAGIENDFVLEKLFHLLAGDKEKLTKFRMGKRIKELGNGSEGLVWSDFIAALTA